MNGETMGMPVGQVNAILEDELVMRIGIPHRGGRLAFHAFEQGYPAMVSANAFWNPTKREFVMPAATDLTEMDFALDSAGYSAISLWQKKGRQDGIAGVYPWSLEQYLEFANLYGARWMSSPDLCCEPQVAGNQEEVDYRVNTTATLLEASLRVLYEWQNRLARTLTAREVANMIKPVVPVLQGWNCDTYLRSLDLTMQVWERWQPWLAPPALIGVGSVCRRSLNHPTHGLYAILSGLEGRLPKGVRAHLFGVKGSCLAELKMMDWIASADSMAYDFGARVKARESGVSNTVKHRSSEMSRWMSSASSRLKPAPGDQFRLSLAH